MTRDNNKSGNVKKNDEKQQNWKFSSQSKFTIVERVRDDSTDSSVLTKFYNTRKVKPYVPIENNNNGGCLALYNGKVGKGYATEKCINKRENWKKKRNNNKMEYQKFRNE